jgi:hypothetical protein
MNTTPPSLPTTRFIMHDDFAFLSFFRPAVGFAFMGFNLFYGRFSHEAILMLRNALYLADFAFKLRHKRDEKRFKRDSTD